MPCVHFFLIDVSYNAVTSGALQAVCSAIKRTLEELQGRVSVHLVWPYVQKRRTIRSVTQWNVYVDGHRSSTNVE